MYVCGCRGDRGRTGSGRIGSLLAGRREGERRHSRGVDLRVVGCANGFVRNDAVDVHAMRSSAHVLFAWSFCRYR
jgi:hypothetical protein